jgi:hypothetical protein
VAGVFQGKADVVFQGEGFVQLKSPGQVIDLFFHGPDLAVGPIGKRHGIFEHGQEQGFGAVGADDLTAKPGIYQVRDPADVIDVGMGEKQKVDVCRRHRELVEGYLRIMALGNAAVHQDGDAVAAAVVRLKLDQVAGAGDAVFGAEMGDGDATWGHQYPEERSSNKSGCTALIKLRRLASTRIPADPLKSIKLGFKRFLAFRFPMHQLDLARRFFRGSRGGM